MADNGQKQAEEIRNRIEIRITSLLDRILGTAHLASLSDMNNLDEKLAALSERLGQYEMSFGEKIAAVDDKLKSERRSKQQAIREKNAVEQKVSNLEKKLSQLQDELDRSSESTASESNAVIVMQKQIQNLEKTLKREIHARTETEEALHKANMRSLAAENDLVIANAKIAELEKKLDSG